MGCVFSNHFHPGPRRLFQVWNVDEQGRALNCGKIEISDTELILHQKSRPPIRWPLRSLRRYGFDAEVFTFESGRRCPTGEGIYAFRCLQAETLFNALQEQIQHYGGLNSASPEENPAPLSLLNGNTHSGAVSLPSSPTDQDGYLEPNAGTNRPSSLTDCLSNGAAHAVPSSPLYVNEPGACNMTSPSFPHYVNGPPFPSGCIDLNTNYARLDELIKHEQHSQKNGFYVNVSATSPQQPISGATSIFYANVNSPPSPKNTSSLSNPLTYVQLDLDSATDSLHPSSPPPAVAPKDGYATIDFDKTAALSQSVNPCLHGDDSIRKTRHSSTTIPGINPS